MSSSQQTTISYDIKNIDELLQTDQGIRNYSNSLDNGFTNQTSYFLKQRKASNDMMINQSITENSDRKRQQSILSSYFQSPNLTLSYNKNTNNSNSSFNNNLFDKSSLSNSLESFISQISQFIESYSKVDPYISNFMIDVEKVLINAQKEIKRLDKLNFMVSQQLEIMTKTIHQRENMVQKMREENLKMNRQVQQSQAQLEQVKLRHERFTQQNNENFYKISQQIKETINIKSQKQQQQIDRLKQLLGQSKSTTNNFNSKSFNLPFQITPSPISNNNNNNNNATFNKFNFNKDKTVGSQKLPSHLETVFESNKFNNNKSLHNKNHSEDGNQQQIQTQISHLDLNDNQNISEKIMNPSNNNIEQRQSTYFELPDEKFDDVRKFFIQSDLTDLKCNKGQRELNLAKKVKMQKAKLHTMFMLQQPVVKGGVSKKKLTSLLTTPPILSKHSSNNSMPIKTESLVSTPSKLQNSQHQFNQSLAVNYHHTKASSLVQQFFEFKEDKNESKNNNNNNNNQSDIPKQTSYQDTVNTRNDFRLHTSDYHFYSLLLDMSKSEKSIQKVHKENIFLSFLQKVAGQEMQFREFLMNLTPEKYSNLFESIKHILQNEFSSLNMILKLKKIITSVQKMHSSLMLTDAFNTIINETCSVLSCDRASVFLIDPRRNELWTKVAKNSKQIRVPLGKGFAGVVAQTGEILNILDAHQDSRFNKEIDKMNEYRTKSVLCLPIKDQNQIHIIGVLQAINKSEGEFFTKEDEGLLQILAQLATAVLRNSLYHDEREVFHNSLKVLLYSGITLQQETSLKGVMIKAQQILLDDFDVPLANLWIHDINKNELFRYYIEDESYIGVQTDQIDDNAILQQRCADDQGIVGHIFQTCNSENILNAYQHQLYNSCIDLNTSMPVITIILKSQLDKLDKSNYKKIGVLQCINPKGLESLVFNQSKSSGSSSNGGGGVDIPHAFYETLEYLGQIIGDNVKRFISYDYV